MDTLIVGQNRKIFIFLTLLFIKKDRKFVEKM